MLILEVVIGIQEFLIVEDIVPVLLVAVIGLEVLRDSEIIGFSSKTSRIMSI